MKWTKNSVKKFASMIEDSTVEQLKSYIDNSGDGHIPPESWEYSDYYSFENIVSACMKKPNEAVEKISFFIEEGMDKPDYFTFGTLVKGDYRGNIESTPEELEAMKDVFRLLYSKGWRISETDDWDLWLAVRAYHADFEFLMFLSKMGLKFNEAKELSYSISEMLFENSSIDTLDFLVGKGLRLTRWGMETCTIAAGWTEEFVDYLLLKGQAILLEGFDPDCDFAIYRYAVEKAGMKCDDASTLWWKVINSKRFDIGEYLLQKGITVCSERVYIRINDIEAIDWAFSKGIKIEVDINRCSRDTLLYAAKHGARPRGQLRIDTKTHQEYWLSRDYFDGMRAICELFDFELIKAFLDAGFADEADASSALKAGNQELIDLYASYGIDTTLKTVFNGSMFVKGGIAKIPEGVEEIAHDAFEGVEFKSVELPSTLRIIGDRAFARGEGMPEVEEVLVPKGVTSLGYGAFKGFKKVSVYDNLDGAAAPAHSKVDECDGYPNGSVGWVGVSPYVIAFSPQCASRADHEIIVLSAETGEVKFRVDMPIGSAARNVYCTLVSAWGKNVEFDFSVYKKIFKKLPGKESKLKTAINRLTWPVNLDEEGREFYEKHVVRNAKDAAALFAEQNDLDGFKLLASIGAIKKTNIDDMVSFASNAHRESIVEYLKAYKAESLPATKAATTKGASKSSKPVNQKTPKGEEPQIANEQKTPSSKKANGPLPTSVLKQLAAGLETGDASALEYIDSKDASKIKPEVAVGYLESAAKNCQPEDINSLYGSFSDFEFQTGALVVALTEGKEENAIALMKNGAHLDNSCGGMSPKGDTDRKMQKRIDGFYSKTAEAISLKKGNVPSAIESLVEKDAFCENDLKVLLLLAIRDGNDSLAGTLREKGALGGGGFICIQKGSKKKLSSMAYSPADFLSATAKPEVARAACAADPQAINRCWNKKMASKGALLKEIAPYLRESAVVGCINDIVIALASEGDITSLKTVLSWPNALKEQTLSLAVDAASTAGKTEALAFLIDVKSAAFDSSFSLSFDDEVEEALKTVSIPAYEPSDYSDSSFEFTFVPEFSIKDKIFVFTGLGSEDEERAFAIVKNSGGIVKSSVVLKTDYLVVNEDYGRQTTKYDRAVELNEQGKDIGIIALSDFYKYAEML